MLPLFLFAVKITIIIIIEKKKILICEVYGSFESAFIPFTEYEIAFHILELIFLLLYKNRQKMICYIIINLKMIQEHLNKLV